MTAFFVCGVSRVALVAVYLTLVIVDEAQAAALHVPFACLVLAHALYDLVSMVRRG